MREREWDKSTTRSSPQSNESNVNLTSTVEIFLTLLSIQILPLKHIYKYPKAPTHFLICLRCLHSNLISVSSFFFLHFKLQIQEILFSSTVLLFLLFSMNLLLSTFSTLLFGILGGSDWSGLNPFVTHFWILFLLHLFGPKCRPKIAVFRLLLLRRKGQVNRWRMLPRSSWVLSHTQRSAQRSPT